MNIASKIDDGFRLFTQAYNEGKIGACKKGKRTTGYEWEFAAVSNLGGLLAEPEFFEMCARLESAGCVVQRELLAACVEVTPESPFLIGSSVARIFGDMMSKVKTASTPNHKVLATGIVPTLGKKDFVNGAKSECVYQGGRYKLFDGIYGSHFSTGYKLPLCDESTHWASFAGCCSFQAHLLVDPENALKMKNISDFVTAIILGAFVCSPHNMGVVDEGAGTEGGYLEHRPGNWRTVFQNRSGYGGDWATDMASYAQQLRSAPSFLVPPVGSESIDSLIDEHMPDVNDWDSLAHLKYHMGTQWPYNRISLHMPNPGTFDCSYMTLETRLFGSGNPYQNQMAYALWLGLMLYFDKTFSTNKEFVAWAGDFSKVSANLDSVCRHGLQAMVHWRGSRTSVKSLLLETFIPVASGGLRAVGEDITPLGKLSFLVSQDWTPAKFVLENWGDDLVTRLTDRILMDPCNW